MRPPDQIPDFRPATFKPGDDAYLWTGRNYSLKAVVTSHDWNSALTVKDGIGKMQVGGHEVISAEQFRAEQREEKREKYAELIRLWGEGKRLHDLVKLWGEPPMVVGRKIAIASRWKLIENVQP